MLGVFGVRLWVVKDEEKLLSGVWLWVVLVSN
jgi:hypothetical protein